MKVFIDSNIPMCVAGGEHPNRAPARRFLARVRAGEVEGCTSVEVLQEILYRYSAIGRRDTASEVYSLFVEICPEIFDVTLADTDGARDLISASPGLSARDALHAAVMRNHDVRRIATFDRHFDKLPRIRRVRLV